MFCLALVGGTQDGLRRYDIARNQDLQDYYRAFVRLETDLVQSHVKRLTRCSTTESQVNQIRASFLLKPLPTASFCPMTLPGTGDILPLLSPSP